MACESWAACAAPAPRELSDLHCPGSSPTALSRPSCTGASMRVARLRPTPYANRTSPTNPLRGVLIQVACAEPAHPDESFNLCGLSGSSPPVQLPVCTRRGNARDAGSLVQPVLCTAYWSRVPARPLLLILSPSACATVAHLFPSRSLSRTWKDGARDAGFPSSSLSRTWKDGARDAGFLSPPTTTSLTTRVDTHVAGENEFRSRMCPFAGY